MKPLSANDGRLPESEAAPDVPGAQALVRGLDVLLAIGSAAEPPRFRDLQQAVGIPKGSLHRLIAALQSRRLVRYDEQTKRYSAGSRVLDLARRTLDQVDLIKAAKPELARLARRLKRPACLFIQDGGELFVLDFEDPDAGQSRVIRVWPRVPIGSSAAGIAIAAALPTGKRADLALDKAAEAGIGLAQALGYAVVRGDAPDGRAASVAAAIGDGSGFPVGAICCPSDGAPQRPEELHESGRLILEAARRTAGNVGQSAYTPYVLDAPPGPSPADLSVLDTGRDFVGENPVWNAADQTLYWLDVLAPALRWFRVETSEVGRIVLPDVFAGMATMPDGRLALAGRGGLFSFDLKTDQLNLIIQPESAKPDNRLNTAAVDAKGALWVSSMPLDGMSNTGSLYRITAELEAEVKLPQVFMAKNVAWSPDQRELYLTEGRDHTVYAYAVDPAGDQLTKRRVLMQGSPDIGSPNGITVDTEGGIWVAMIGGWSVRRYLPDGTLDRQIPLPIPMPTNLAFGGESLETLYVTSTYIRVPTGFSTRAPQSGKLVVVEAGIRGQPSRQFGTGAPNA